MTDINFLNEPESVIAAFAFAAHEGQVRKYSGEPYKEHLKEVAAIVNPIDLDGTLTPIALLHDVLEDTEVSEEELYKLIMNNYSIGRGRFIFFGVKSLTDEYTKENYPDLNRTIRKGHECERLHRIRDRYQTVKYADLINNLSSIVDNDPKFAEVYVEEKKAILKGMNKGNFDLYLRACSELHNAINKLKA